MLQPNTDTIKVVSSCDPAVDQKASRLDKYYATRDLKHLVIKEGATPAYFYLRRIPRSLVTQWIQSAPNDNQAFVRAFECALVCAENVVTEDGKVIPRWEPKWVTSRSSTPVLEQDEMNLFHPDDVVEIGHLAYERAFLRPGREPCYPVPPLSHVRLERALRRPVEEVLTDLDQSSDESPAP